MVVSLLPATPPVFPAGDTIVYAVLCVRIFIIIINFIMVLSQLHLLFIFLMYFWLRLCCPRVLIPYLNYCRVIIMNLHNAHTPLNKTPLNRSTAAIPLSLWIFITLTRLIDVLGECFCEVEGEPGRLFYSKTTLVFQKEKDTVCVRSMGVCMCASAGVFVLLENTLVFSEREDTVCVCSLLFCFLFLWRGVCLILK